MTGSAGAFAAQFVVTRTSARRVAVVSFVLMGGGLLLLMQVPITAVYFHDLFPGLVLFGLGLGGTSVACSIAALSGVAEHHSGLASGINSASFQIGGALGVAIVSTVFASAVTRPIPTVMISAFHDGFTACLVIAAVGVLLTLTMLTKPKLVPVSVVPAHPRTLAQPVPEDDAA